MAQLKLPQASLAPGHVKSRTELSCGRPALKHTAAPSKRFGGTELLGARPSLGGKTSGLCPVFLAICRAGHCAHLLSCALCPVTLGKHEFEGMEPRKMQTNADIISIVQKVKIESQLPGQDV